MAWQGFGLHSIYYPSRTPRIYSEKTPSSSSSRVVEKSLDRTVYYPKEQEATSPFAEDQQQQEVGSSSNDGAAFHDELNYCKLAQGQGNASSVEGGEDCNQTVLSSRVPTSPVALLETHGGSDMETPVPEKKRSRGEWISRPYKMWGETHVTYNAEFARYEGLPAEWRELNHQFGLPLEVVLKREVEGYESKLPAVLVMMKTCFLAHNGARTEGVFRLAPDKQEYSAVKHSINNGTFEDCADVHIMASLIKVISI
ncbi:unnamed protein product [Phytophthora lilii]|uniref:Unnamed protein product n=1 Tax=Phytophthora lilii TaxID=2077276 RepID=A0A9W6TEC2_9STRA|nr:unnamed protein product [Phytophthora lilii]